VTSGSAFAQPRAQVYVSGLSQPLGFVQDPSDATVQYVVEQGGRIRVVRNGTLLSADFLNLSAAITSGGERGLLGLAFPPDYATSGRFYVNFTDLNGNTVVSRFKRSAVAACGRSGHADPVAFGPAPSTALANHNGGLVFGPDGYLYIGMGDGGSANDPGNLAQTPGSLLGKMLRIDVGVPDTDPKGYRVPPDNPFLSGSPVAALGEIWAFGLRNPWHFSFDDPARGGTGALVIGDVGQNSWEEVDYEPAGHGGRNYGWRNREGAHPNVTSLPPAYLPLIDPIFEYSHADGVAITGGFVYRGLALGPQYRGRYFFADFGLGRVWSLGLRIGSGAGEASFVDQREHTSELGGTATLGAISSIGVDAGGELYLVNYSAGTIVRVTIPDADGDGLPDWWESRFGLDPSSAAGANGAGGDPDGDGQSNFQEYQAGTHPRGFFRRYFAEGAVSAFFDVSFALLNPSQTAAAGVLLRYEKDDGTVSSQFVAVPAFTRRTAVAKDAPSMVGVSFSTIVESDEPVVADRTMTWDADAYGAHAETGIEAPATTWYLAEGATHSGFQLYYLIQNPNAVAAGVRVTYLLPAPSPPVVKTYTVNPGSRSTIFVNAEDPRLAGTDVSAVLTSTNNQPIVVERAMYSMRTGSSSAPVTMAQA
jgi:glucose/arabinose dehydrogenase